MRKLIMATLLGVVLIGTGVTVANSASIYEPAVDNQENLVFRGGPIRLGSKPYVLADVNHAAVGITGLGLRNRCDLVIYTDWKVGEKIVSAVIEEDETISRRGIQAGLSGGRRVSTVLLYRDGRHICATDRMFGRTANIWVSLTYLKS